MIKRSFVLLAFAWLVACSPQPAAEPTPDPSTATHPISGLEVIQLTVDTGEAEHAFRVEVAATPEARRQGLMFRTNLPDDEGMIFLSPRPQVESFWMRNTPIPLDIIFIEAGGRILNIARETVPYSLESVRSEGPVTAVLELRGGLTEELGIEPGDSVRW